MINLPAFAENFYTLPIMICCNILFLAILFTRKKQFPYFTAFKLYGLITLIQDFLSFFYITSKILYIATIFVALIELISFYIYYSFLIKDLIIQKKIIKAGAIFISVSVLLIIYTIFIVPKSQVNEILSYYVVICNLINVAPAFFFIYHMFLKPSVPSLLRNPPFWIIIGILILNSIEIPIFLIQHYLKSNHMTWLFSIIYSLNYVAYCILFITFSISLLCHNNPKRLISGELQ
jgi:hypothetical protein